MKFHEAVTTPGSSRKTKIEIDREAIPQFGISVDRVQEVIEVAIGGHVITQTIEGRERYPVRVRYLRELRGDWESIEGILVAARDGSYDYACALTCANLYRSRLGHYGTNGNPNLWRDAICHIDCIYCASTVQLSVSVGAQDGKLDCYVRESLSV